MDYLKEESGVRYLYPKCMSKTMKLGLRKTNQWREAQESHGDTQALKRSANFNILRGNETQ